jgi:hypothetical protein
MVGVLGFEPRTSCSQSKRTTGLCYTPNKTWMRVTDSNRRSSGYEPNGMTTSLTRNNGGGWEGRTPDFAVQAQCFPNYTNPPWCLNVNSNHGPPPYQDGALTN